ncbi:MAG TPA: MFS transporter [Chloroflexota bacterium]|nr:MFS transporter [Chloroflexota bacterium]
MRTDHHPFYDLVPWQRTLGIMFIAQLVTAVGFSIFFPFLPLYVAELGSSTSLSVAFLAGAVFSAQAFTMAIASPIWGAVADRYGRKLMVERAMFGGAVVLLLMGFAHNAEQLVLLRAIQGLITGTVAAANALVAAAAPRERTGFAMGLLQTGLVSGIAIGPLLGGLVADAFGYRYAFVITSVLLLAAGLLVWWGVTEEFTPPPKTETKRIRFWQEWRDVWQMPGISLAYSLRFLSNLGQSLLLPFAPLFIASLLTDQSRVNTITGLTIGVTAGAGTLTAVLLGRLGDKVGHRKVLIGSALLAGLFYLPQSQVTTAGQLLLLQALTGAAAGGVIPSISALLAHYSRSEQAGSVYGLENSIVSASRAIAPILGSLVVVWFGLRAAFIAAGVVYLMVALVTAVRLPRITSTPVEPLESHV